MANIQEKMAEKDFENIKEKEKKTTYAIVINIRVIVVNIKAQRSNFKKLQVNRRLINLPTMKTNERSE